MHKVSKALIGLLSGSFFLLYGCRTAAPTESEGEGFLKRQIIDGSATALSKVLERTGAKVSKTREGRFLGKVTESQAKRRGGEQALKRNKTPWIDWGAYYGSRDVKDEGKDQRGFANIVSGATSGHYGSLLDLEVQRVELLKFNMYDTNGEYDDYRSGNVTKKIFPSLQGLDCGEENDYGNKKWWFRTTDGRCNDMQNPKMGMANLAFPRNADFMATFPDIERGNGPTIKNGIKVHYALNDPDPKKVSDILLKRDGANHGQYIGAPFFNLLAAFWIQFQTHDWFDHSKDGINKPGSKMPIYNDGSLMADRSIENPEHDKIPGTKPPKTFQNQVTPWWDCSQLYGWNPDSSMRVRDPNDRAKLRILANGQLPLFVDTDPVQPRYVGQEVAAFPTNWSLGVAMFHTIFVKEHNTFVDRLRVYIRTHRDEKIGEGAKITYGQLTDDDIFNLARLVVVAEVAKIHTIEWTTQLLLIALCMML
ncbi:MAG: peroxidase family protein [Bdellovibrionota bacterium]